MNGPPVTLRQAQGEDLMVGLSKHEVRDKESRFPKSRMTRRKGPYGTRLKTRGETPAGIAMVRRRSRGTCGSNVRFRAQSGFETLVVATTAFDPKRTFKRGKVNGDRLGHGGERSGELTPYEGGMTTGFFEPFDGKRRSRRATLLYRAVPSPARTWRALRLGRNR